MLNFIATLALPVLMAGAPPVTAAPSAPIDSTDMTLVVVENDRNVPVTIYGQNGAGESKLGVVAPHASVTMAVKDVELDWGPVTFFVHSPGAADESSGSLDIHRGEHVGLVVPER